MRETDWLMRAAGLFGVRHPGVPVGIGDDCAVLEPHGPTLVSSDTVVDGVHFDHHQIGWDDIGWRTLAVALSDLAACGCDPTRPMSAFLAVQLPPLLADADLLFFARGLAECAREHDCVIAGGDTVSTAGPFAATVTVVGYSDRAILRSGAREGDLIAVTGPIGQAAAGFYALTRPSATATEVAAAYCRPRAQLAAGAKLARAATAMIDISDGLVGDLDRLCHASGIGARIELRNLPMTPAAREVLQAVGPDPLALAATFGDDYQLLCSLHPSTFDWMHAEVPGLTAIGVITAGDRTVVLRDGREIDLTQRSYEHGGPAKGEL